MKGDFGANGRKLFINHRRSEDKAAARRLNDQLESVCGRDRIFVDIDGILAVKDFFEELSGRIAEMRHFPRGSV
jgi:hypothetical protein